jgi:hypothetical protein
MKLTVTMVADDIAALPRGWAAAGIPSRQSR